MTESSFIIIPLLITFLSVLQVGVGAMSRSVAENRVQGAVARQAINSDSGYQLNSDMNTSNLLNITRYSLPGGGNLVVGKESIRGVTVTPLLPTGDNFNVEGYAIEEG